MCVHELLVAGSGYGLFASANVHMSEVGVRFRSTAHSLFVSPLRSDFASFGYSFTMHRLKRVGEGAVEVT